MFGFTGTKVLPYSVRVMLKVAFEAISTADVGITDPIMKTEKYKVSRLKSWETDDNPGRGLHQFRELKLELGPNRGIKVCVQYKTACHQTLRDGNWNADSSGTSCFGTVTVSDTHKTLTKKWYRDLDYNLVLE